MTLVDTAAVGEFTSLAIGVEGLPIVSYYDAAGDLEILHCGSALCLPYFRRQ